MNNSNLQKIIGELIRSDSQSNPAMSTLLADYAKYHVVLLIIGGFFVLVIILFSLFCWVRFKKAPNTTQRRWMFERKTYFSLGIVSTLVSLLLALIVVANASNVLNPRHGFSLLIDSLGSPNPGTQLDRLQQAFNGWIQSGSSNIPPLIQSKIDERIASHATKAIVCGVLLIVFAVFGTHIWSTLIKKFRIHESKWGLKERVALVYGVVTAPICLLLIVIIIANTQGAFAPITLTLFYS